MAKTIAIDFDGVLHAYSKGWQDGSLYDGPVDGAEEALLALDASGYKLVIYTARTLDSNLAEIAPWIGKHMPKVAELKIPITNRKPVAWRYIDDRAIQFITWLQSLDEIEAAERIEMQQERDHSSELLT